MLIRYLFLALLIALLVLIFKKMRGAKGLFEIQIGQDRVDIFGAVLTRSDGDVREFMHTMRLPIGSRIRAVPHQDSFRLQFSKEIRDEDRDKIREFFHS